MNEIIQDILSQFKQQTHEGTLKRYQKVQEVEPYYAVPMGVIGKLAKLYKKQPELALPLWQTGILEAQYLAVQIMKPKQLSTQEIEICLDERVSVNVLDKFAHHVLSQRPDVNVWKEKLKVDKRPIFRRLGWILEVKAMQNKQADLDEVEALYQTIARTLLTEDEHVQWTINHCLVEMAVNYPTYLDKCLALGQDLALYKEMKVSKGCTSAYAPAWISALLKNRKISE